MGIYTIITWPTIFVFDVIIVTHHFKIARHTRIPTTRATTNPKIPTVMSTVEPLPYLPIFLGNISVLFKGHSQDMMNSTSYYHYIVLDLHSMILCQSWSLFELRSFIQIKKGIKFSWHHQVPKITIALSFSSDSI